MASDPGYRDLDRSAGFDRIVGALDQLNHSGFITATRRIIYRLLRPAPGRRFLDAGSGLGLDIAALGPRVMPGGYVVGLDISEWILRLGRERYGDVSGVRLVAGTIETMPFPDAYFDAAFVMRTLQYMPDPSIALRELMRVVRPGGRVVLAEGGISAADLPDGELTRLVFGPRAPSMGVSIPNLMRRAGLTRIRVYPALGVDFGAIDRFALAYARSSTEVAVDAGQVTQAEADEWLAVLEATSQAGAWFSADCMLVVAGTIPGRRG